MIEELLKFEEDPRILDFKFNEKSISIWPFIRYGFFMRFISEAININQTELLKNNRPVIYKKILNFIKPLFFLNKRLTGSEILFLYDSISNIKDNDGVYFNRLFDYYAGLLEEETVMVESAYTKGHSKARWFRKTHFFQKNINIRRIRTRLGKVSNSDDNEIESFIDYIKKNFPIELNGNDILFLRKSMRLSSVSLKFIDRDYTKLFKKYKPKIVFIEDALYGSQNAAIIKIAKQMGIVTAEFQHGMINMQHIAYSYSQMLCDSQEYRQYTPDYLLTMGKYWSDNCKVPSEKLVVGMPHLYYNVEKILENKVEHHIDKKTILFVAGINEDEYIKYIKALAISEIIDCSIILKVHPCYSTNKNIYQELKEFNNVNIIYEGDIYDYIDKADWVIGDTSTAMYEALVFEKRIVILETEESLLYTPKELGIWVKSPIELQQILYEDKFTDNKTDLEMWGKNWKENYISFIKNVNKE